MYILGINPGSHESSACLLEDNVIIAAAEEERFTRLKYAINQMPLYAIQYCLDKAGIGLADVNYVAICWNRMNQPENSIYLCTPAEVEEHHEYYRGRLFPFSHFGNVELPTVAHVSHHLAHAAAVYRTSPFDQGALLVVDGQGDTVSTTLAHCINGTIRILQQFDISQSLGYFYQAITYYLGLGWLGGEGKTMGLAAYGVPIYDFPEITPTSEGYRIAAPIPTQQDAVDEMLGFWLNHFGSRFGSKRQVTHKYNTHSGRIERSPELGEFEQNLAASAQAKLEHILTHLAQIAMNLCQTTNLMFTGGVALNCSANDKLLEGTSAEQLYLFPACGDSGAAVGAALELAYYLGVTPKVSFHMPYLGPSFSNSTTAQLLDNLGIPYQEVHDPAQIAAERMLDGYVVGWFQDRMEFGPRALGNRSILADPSNVQIRDRVNRRVKSREFWRPLAPSSLEEENISFWGTQVNSPYMLRAITVPEKVKHKLAGTVHVDGTARLQTVREDSNALYHKLISYYHAGSGIPAVLNSSLNGYNEPIVCSHYDAIKTYFSTDLDILIISNLIIESKKRIK